MQKYANTAMLKRILLLIHNSKRLTLNEIIWKAEPRKPDEVRNAVWFLKWANLIESYRDKDIILYRITEGTELVFKKNYSKK